MAEVVVLESETNAGIIAAASIRALISQKADAVLGLATGSTPMSLYSALADSLRQDPLDVSRVRGFALDEYVGLPSGHPESYRTVITRDAVLPLGLTPGNIRVPNGDLATLETAGTDYEAAIRAAGGDVTKISYSKQGHASVALSLAWGFRWLAPTLDDTLKFFAKYDAIK